MRLVSAALVLLVAWTGARVCEASTEQAGQALRLTTHPERDAEPAVSPDGRWVAFASRRTDNWDLWARRIDGGVPFPITDHPAIDRRPRWTHDGHGLLFVSTRDDPEGDLFLVEVKRRGWTCWTVGQPRRLTPRFGLDGDPDPHPKGGKLAFISDRAGQVEIWLLYLGNLHVRRLVRGPVWNPRWSPDGRWLAWIGKARGRPSVILCPYDARRDTLAGTPDTLSTPDNRPVLAFDFDPGQRYLACLLGKQGSADSAGSDVFLLPLPERVSLRGKGSPSALDSLPPCPYRLTFHSEPLGDVAWRHGSLVYHTQEGEILGVPFRGRVPVFHTAGEQLDWANRNARAPTPFDVEDPRVPPRRELELRAEALTRVLEYFPEDTARVAEALFHRANVFHLMGEPTEARQDLARLEKLAEREPQWKWGGWLLGQDIECVRPGRSILFPEAVTGGPGDTAQYLSLARSEDCPPSLRLFALLRAAQVALACGDSVRARKWAGELLGKEGSEPLVAPAGMVLLRSGAPLTLQERLRLVARMLEALRPDDPIAEDLVDRLPSLLSLAKSQAPDALSLLATIGTGMAVQSPSAARRFRFLVARNAIRAGRLHLAEDVLASLLPEAEPVLRPQVLYWLGWVRSKLGAYSGAMEAFDALLELGGLEESLRQEAVRLGGRTLVAWAEALCAEGGCQRAWELARRARRLSSADPQVHRAVVRVAARCGRLPEALSIYHQSYLLHPEDAISEYAYGLALSYQATAEAESSGDIRRLDLKTLRASTEVLEEALRKDFSLGPAYLALAFNYEQLDAYRRARGRPKSDIVRAPVRFATAPFRALYEFVAGGTAPAGRDLERGIQLLRTALQLNDEGEEPELEADLILNLANQTYSLGPYSYREALRLYRQRLQSGVAFRDEVQLAQVLARMGRCALVTQEYDSAASYFLASWKLAVQTRRAADELTAGGLYAFASLEAGKYQDAISALRSLLQRHGPTAPAPVVERLRRNLALAYLEAGEIDSCLAELTRAQEILLSGLMPETRKKPVRVRVEVLGWSLPVPFVNLRRFGLRPAGETEELSHAEELALLQGVAAEALLRAGNVTGATRELEGRLRALRNARGEHALGPTQQELGTAYLLAGQLEVAETYYLRAWRTALESRDWPGILSNLGSLGRLLAYRSLLRPGEPLIARAEFGDLWRKTQRLLLLDRPTSEYWWRWYQLLEASTPVPTGPGAAQAPDSLDLLVQVAAGLLEQYRFASRFADTVLADTVLARTDLGAAALQVAAATAMAMGDVPGRYHYLRRLRRFGFERGDAGLAGMASIELADLISRLSVEQKQELQVPWNEVELARTGKELLLAGTVRQQQALPEYRLALRKAYQIMLESFNTDSLTRDSLVVAYGKDLLALLLSQWEPLEPELREPWGKLGQGCALYHLAGSGYGQQFGSSLSRTRAESLLVKQVQIVATGEPRALRKLAGLLWPETSRRRWSDSLKAHARRLLIDGEANGADSEKREIDPLYVLEASVPELGGSGRILSENPGPRGPFRTRPTWVVSPNPIVPLLSRVLDSREGAASATGTLAEHLAELLESGSVLEADCQALPPYFAHEAQFLAAALSEALGE